MGQNMLYIINKERTRRPSLLFGLIMTILQLILPMGKNLPATRCAKWFGNKYYALALACYEGTFQTRILLPDKYWGALKIDTIPPFEKSINWYLPTLIKNNYLLIFVHHPSNAMVDKWLETSQKFSYGYWKFGGANPIMEILFLNPYMTVFYMLNILLLYTQPGMHWKKVQKIMDFNDDQIKWWASFFSYIIKSVFGNLNVRVGDYDLDFR